MSFEGPPTPPQSQSYPEAVQPPPNYLVWAVLTTIFCFFPLGIVAIIFATQVNSKFGHGDLSGAQASSRKAKLWVILTVVIGVVANAIIFGIIGLAMFFRIAAGPEFGTY